VFVPPRPKRCRWSRRWLLRNRCCARATRLRRQFLEAKIPELSDVRLSNLLEDARRQKDQFQRGLRSAMEQAQRILQDHGAVETAKYLEIHRSATAKLQNFGLSPTLL